jgi:hypothetical protein
VAGFGSLRVVSTNRPSGQRFAGDPQHTKRASLIFTLLALAEIAQASAQGFVGDLRALIAHRQSTSESGDRGLRLSGL